MYSARKLEQKIVFTSRVLPNQLARTGLSLQSLAQTRCRPIGPSLGLLQTQPLRRLNLSMEQRLRAKPNRPCGCASVCETNLQRKCPWLFARFQIPSISLGAVPCASQRLSRSLQARTSRCMLTPPKPCAALWRPVWHPLSTASCWPTRRKTCGSSFVIMQAPRGLAGVRCIG